MTQFIQIARGYVVIVMCVASLFLTSYLGVASEIGSTAVSAQDLAQTDDSPQHPQDQQNGLFSLEASTNPPLLVDSGPYETVITITNISGSDLASLKLSLFLEGGASVVEVNPAAPVFSTLTLWPSQLITAGQHSVYRVTYNVSDAVPVTRIVGDWTVDTHIGVSRGLFTVTRPVEQLFLPTVLRE